MKSLEAQAQAALNKAMDIHPVVHYAGCNPSKSIKVWFVGGKRGDYGVYEENGQMHCTCPAGERGIICYHRAAVLLSKLERDAAAAFNAALDASIASAEAEDDALAMAVGGWFLDQQAKAERAVNNGFKQRMVERIRESDKIMGRHTELGPTLKPYDFVEADKATALPANDLGFYFDASGLPLKSA